MSPKISSESKLEKSALDKMIWRQWILLASIPVLATVMFAGVLSVSNEDSDIQYDNDDLTTIQVFAETAEYCIRHAENADWMRTMIHQLRDLKAPATETDPALASEDTRAVTRLVETI